jgi:hypothetical protein
MTEAMEQDGMYARVGGQDLDDVARRRVSVEHAVNVFSELAEHVLDPSPCGPNF